MTGQDVKRYGFSSERENDENKADRRFSVSEKSL